MECPENLLNGAALAVLQAPAAQGLGHRIDVVDHPFGVRGDDPIADALQGDLRALLLAEQRLFVELALRDVEFHSHQTQQPAFFVDLGLGAADHPAPLAGGMAHTMQAFENRRLAGDVIADGGLHP